jgi:hypothetical protein
MVKSRPRRSTKQLTQEESPAQEGDRDIRGFLQRELPRPKRKQAPYIADFLLEAAARYDRYTARRDEWWDYTPRKRQLQMITKQAKELAGLLCALDILTRDDFARRVGTKEIEALVGSLVFLAQETKSLADGIQTDGRPRDLAEERWILEVADAYEDAFGRRASVWSSGSGAAKERGNFIDSWRLAALDLIPGMASLIPGRSAECLSVGEDLVSLRRLSTCDSRLWTRRGRSWKEKVRLVLSDQGGSQKLCVMPYVRLSL